VLHSKYLARIPNNGPHRPSHEPSDPKPSTESSYLIGSITIKLLIHLSPAPSHWETVPWGKNRRRMDSKYPARIPNNGPHSPSHEPPDPKPSTELAHLIGGITIELIIARSEPLGRLRHGEYAMRTVDAYTQNT
jgi:hypothetical protein